MIDLKDEILYDFEINRPRILVSDKLMVVDSITKLLDFTENTIIALSGKDYYTVINGEKLCINSLQNERMVCSGTIASVEFHRNKDSEGAKDEG